VSRTPEKRALRAAIYCRISLSRFGDTLKVDDQEQLCRQVAATRGWIVMPEHVYKDNSQSAWRRDRKRPRWDAMLDAVNRGEIDAIVVYHGDRLVRQPRDLEDLIDLADRKGIRLASPTGDRDLDDGDDRFVLRILAAQACKESDNTSRRLKRQYDLLAEQGLCRLGGRGGRAFGFAPDGRTIIESDAEMLREVAERIIAGEPVGAVCRDINARGFVTATGGSWDHGALKKLMMRPRLAGLLTRHGTIVGKAAWGPILDRDTWEAVVATLEGKATRFAYTTNARRYLLTGIAVCGTPGCGHPLAIRHNTRSNTLRGYGCINSACGRKVHRAVHHLDPYVESCVVGRLQDDRLRQRLTAPTDASGVATAAELAKLERLREQKFAEFADDEDPLAADVLRVSIGRLDQRIQEVRSRVAEVRRFHALDDLWGISLDDFKGLPLARRRRAAQSAVRITVFPAGRRGPGFDPTTVKVADAL
jgi:site-specific DNA recombinase